MLFRSDCRLCYTVSAPGEHWVANSLAVMAMAITAVLALVAGILKDRGVSAAKIGVEERVRYFIAAALLRIDPAYGRREPSAA